MAASRLPPAFWVLPASLLAAVLAGTLLGEPERSTPAPAASAQTAAAKPAP
jgi:hypothetical protein